jgi:hypothetical protein
LTEYIQSLLAIAYHCDIAIYTPQQALPYLAVDCIILC